MVRGANSPLDDSFGFPPGGEEEGGVGNCAYKVTLGGCEHNSVHVSAAQCRLILSTGLLKIMPSIPYDMRITDAD